MNGASAVPTTPALNLDFPQLFPPMSSCESRARNEKISDTSLPGNSIAVAMMKRAMSRFAEFTFLIGHVRYINIQAWLRGFRVKIANFSSFFCPPISKRLRYKENNTKYRSLPRKPRSHVRILIYWTWPIETEKSRRLIYRAEFSKQTKLYKDL